jgi:hypothetical protein
MKWKEMKLSQIAISAPIRERANNATTRDRYPARSKDMGRREYVGSYPCRRYRRQSSDPSKSIFHYGWIPTREGERE